LLTLDKTLWHADASVLQSDLALSSFNGTMSGRDEALSRRDKTLSGFNKAKEQPDKSSLYCDKAPLDSNRDRMSEGRGGAIFIL
jgi:hypothetical protein